MGDGNTGLVAGATLGEKRAIADKIRTLVAELIGSSENRADRAIFVRTLLRLRMRRGCSLDSELFGEPAWDMLLDLYAAALEGRRLSVSSSCLAAGVPPTTALRWQRLLVERELVERVPDLEDNRRTYLQLTPEGFYRVEKVIGEWERALISL